jgi:hypothetical protein
MSISVPEDARLEIKFVAHERFERLLASWFEGLPACFVEPFPARWVNNVYFDTYDYLAFRDNLSGASQRHKLRYRWYGESALPGPGTVEVKCKRNFYGWKLRYPVRELPCREGDRWREIRRQIAAQLPAEGRMWLEANPQPVIINRYYRRYLVTHDQKVRATIDTRASVYDQRYNPSPSVRRPANVPNVLVVELKFERSERERASRLVEGLPLRVSRHSKYVSGVQAIQGY